MRSNGTRGERIIGHALKRYPLTFNIQYVIDDYIVDFCNRKTKLIIEADGCSHDKENKY